MACDLKQSLQRLLITFRAKVFLKALLLSCYYCFVIFMTMAQFLGFYACYLWLLPLLSACYQAYRCPNMDLILKLDQALKQSGQLEIAYELCMTSTVKQERISRLQEVFHQQLLKDTQNSINSLCLSQYQLDLNQNLSLSSIHQLYYPLVKLHFDQDPKPPKKWMIDLFPLLLILSAYQAFQCIEEAQPSQTKITIAQKNNTAIPEKKPKKLKAFSHKTADDILKKNTPKQELTESEFNKALKNSANQHIHQPEIKEKQVVPQQALIDKAQEIETAPKRSLKINAGQQKSKQQQQWEQKDINLLKKKDQSNIKSEKLPFAKAGLLEPTAQEQTKQWQKKLHYYPLYQQKMIKKYLISTQAQSNEFQDQSQGVPK